MVKCKFHDCNFTLFPLDEHDCLYFGLAIFTYTDKAALHIYIINGHHFEIITFFQLWTVVPLKTQKQAESS